VNEVELDELTSGMQKMRDEYSFVGKLQGTRSPQKLE